MRRTRERATIRFRSATPQDYGCGTTDIRRSAFEAETASWRRDRRSTAGAEAMAIAALGFIAADPEAAAALPGDHRHRGAGDPAGRGRAGIPGRRPAVHPRARADADRLRRTVPASRRPPCCSAMRALPLGDDSYEASTELRLDERRSRNRAADRRTVARHAAAAGARRRRCAARIHPARSSASSDRAASNSTRSSFRLHGNISEAATGAAGRQPSASRRCSTISSGAGRLADRRRRRRRGIAAARGEVPRSSC